MAFTLAGANTPHQSRHSTIPVDEQGPGSLTRHFGAVNVREGSSHSQDGSTWSPKPRVPHMRGCEKSASSASLQWHATESTWHPFYQQEQLEMLKELLLTPSSLQCLIKNHWNQEDKKSYKLSWSLDPSLMWERIKSDENKWTFLSCGWFFFFFLSQNHTHLTFLLGCWIFVKSEASIFQTWQFSIWYFSV